MNSDFLMHYGIKGMKWGVRRTPEQLGHHDSSKDSKSNKKFHHEKLKIFGRNFDLPIHSVSETYEGAISDSEKKIRDKVKNTKFSDSIKPLRDYITKYDSDFLKAFDPNDKEIKNPFRYIKPKSVYVYDGSRYGGDSGYAVICNYRFDPEHGLAIDYDENGKHRRITQQGNVL